MGRLTSGLAACLWLWSSAGALSAATSDQPATVSPYQRALDRFNHEDYSHALSLLEQSPASSDAHEQADILNLKGAIYLRQHRDDQARAAFAEASRLDSGLWAARFNAAEVSFREKQYEESHREFDALLGHTSRVLHAEERHLIEYKLRLADLLAGKEQPALDYIAAHRGERPPPLAWYYLNAALEYQHGHTASGDAWLQQVGTQFEPATEQVFARSLAELGWANHSGAARPHDTPVKESPEAVSPAVLAKTAPAPAVRQATRKSQPTTVAVVELIPDQKQASQVSSRDNPGTAGLRPGFHLGSAGDIQPDQTTATQMPPAAPGLNPLSGAATADPVRRASPVAKVLARHKSSSSHASPTATPADSPADNENTSPSPLPSPDAAATPVSKTTDAAPVGTPSAAFIQKYEAAMVQFLQKDYPASKKLLDEADAIQPRQPNSISLRNQIFKAYYEAAYAAYQHADYQTAATQLDGADGVGSNPQNQSDAYNLRGLVLSKQRNYPEAEAMFHKAALTDPGLWAAKFNYAEVPFNYKNFTVARARFEELFTQTDPAKQPVEAELTQFKVFLTLLLEGKEDAARTFMQHFNFSGVTPARYFCQSALNFYSGDVDKAQGWIDSARKEYPARKSSSFLEAFYRVGWLVDPNAPAGSAPATALAVASPAASPPAVPASASPAPALAAVTSPPSPAATPVPAASRPATAATTFTPPIVAVATPPLIVASSPSAVPAFRAAVTPPAPPTVAAASPTPKLAASTPASTVAPVPTAPKVAVATPPASTVAPVPTAPKVALATTPRPAPSVPVARTPAAQPSPTPAPTAEPALAAEPASTGGDVLRVLIVGFVLLYFLYVVARIVFSAATRKPRRPAGRMPSLGNRGGEKPDQVEMPR